MQLTPEFYAPLEPSDEYCSPLHERMWLMDNHKWAAWTWELQFGRMQREERPNLLHFDYHFDSGDDHSAVPDELELLKAETLDQLKRRIDTENWIKYDSFIAPALLRGVVADVHFFCLQDDEWDHGFDEDLLRSTGFRQYFYGSVPVSACVFHQSPELHIDAFSLCVLCDDLRAPGRLGRPAKRLRSSLGTD